MQHLLNNMFEFQKLKILNNFFLLMRTKSRTNRNLKKKLKHFLPLSLFKSPSRSYSRCVVARAQCNCSFCFSKVSKDTLYFSSRFINQRSISFSLFFIVFNSSRSHSKELCCISLKTCSATYFCHA